ncbi:MAG: hypothetical protein RKE49_07395 [Oceanicaulis sp.]
MPSPFLIPGPGAFELPGVSIEIRPASCYVLMRLTGFLSASNFDDALTLLVEVIEDEQERTVVVDARASYWPLDAETPGTNVCETLHRLGAVDAHVLCRNMHAPIINTLRLLVPAGGGRLHVYDDEAEILAWHAARRFETPPAAPRRNFRSRLKTQLATRCGPIRKLMAAAARRTRRSPARQSGT